MGKFESAQTVNVYCPGGSLGPRQRVFQVGERENIGIEFKEVEKIEYKGSVVRVKFKGRFKLTFSGMPYSVVSVVQ